MKKLRVTMRTFALLGAALVPGVGLASVEPPAPVTLREAVSEALRAGDMVRVQDSRVAAATAGVAAARSHLLPQVEFEERFLRTDTPAYAFSFALNQGEFSSEDLQRAPDSFNDPDARNDFQTALTLRQPLYARRATLGLEMARAEAEATAHDRAQGRAQAALAAYQAWLGALVAESYRGTALAAQEDAAEHLRLARVAEEAGTGLAADRLRAEVALGEARRMRLEAENGLEIARHGLGLAMGREEAVTPAPAEIPAEEAPPLPALLERTAARPDLRAMSARVENSGRNIALARAAWLPEVGLFGTLQANDSDQPLGTSGTSYAFGLALNWNLFAGGRSRAEEAKARAEHETAERMRAGMEKEARFRVREAWLRAAEAREGVRIAAAARDAAAEAVRLVRVRYENGLATMVALLDAQSALNRARADAVRAKAALAGAAGELRFRSGTLLEDLGFAGEGERTDAVEAARR